MASQGSQTAVRIYIAAMTLALLAIMAVTLADPDGFKGHLVPWIALTVLFTLGEFSTLFFHVETGRVGLSSAETILLPMLVALSFNQVVWGVVLGTGMVYVIAFRRVGLTKTIFNIAMGGCAAAAAAGVWSVIKDSAPLFSVRDALGALLAAVTYAVITHFTVAAAIALSEGKSTWALTRDALRPTLISLAGSIMLGLLFAASYLSARWTLFVFPVLLGALFIGYRAIIRQLADRERVEHLHAASRALAAGSDFEDALHGFLDAVREIVSSQRMIAVVKVRDAWSWMGVRSNGPSVVLQPLGDDSLDSLLQSLIVSKKPLLMTGDSGDAERGHLEQLEAANLLAVPLIDNEEVVGILVALGRIGAEEFGDSEKTLLQALANELVLTLDSYRLFEEVREERERFQRIFTGSKEGICLIDEGGVIRAWNPALARITGYEESEVLGQRWADRIMVRDRNHQRIDGMGIVSVAPDEELEVVTKQGPARWTTMISGQVQAGEERSWVVLVRDITREHELEEAKSDFLSTVSHELRTPLTTIKGSLQVLSRPNPSPEMSQQMVAIMKRGSDRLERLVMNLLAVSQLEMGDVQVFPDEINIEELVKARIDTVLPDHPQVELNIDEEIVVRADRERLAQVVEHLLDNARKFGGEEGKIVISVLKENGFAHVTVTDEGPGIPKIDQDRIFERFVRLGHVLTRETQGPGVGLYIAKRSIEAMGGSISVDSAPDQGATFHVRVPLARPMAVTGADATA